MSTSPPPERRRLARKLLLSAAALLVALAVAELVARRGYDVHGARSQAKALLQTFDTLGALEADGEAVAAPAALQNQTLHPFLGYDSVDGIRRAEEHVELLRAGGAGRPYTVLLVGGSVAQHFGGMQFGALDILRGRLRAHPSLAGRNVRFLLRARAGYKQPQQLLVLTQLLARGAAPDAVINLDGFNELVLGSLNVQRGLPIPWPSANHWAHLARGRDLPLRAIDAAAQMRTLERSARNIGPAGWQHAAYRSALFGRLQLGRLRAYRGEWAKAQQRYADLLIEGSEPLIPREEQVSPERILAEAADVWAESSRVLHELCAARGILYLHFLQPALHLPGSKPITDEERRLGLGPAGPDPQIVEGYPLLLARADVLRARGVQVIDLTNIFQDVHETLYFDNCHFVRAGHELLAERFATELTARIER